MVVSLINRRSGVKRPVAGVAPDYLKSTLTAYPLDGAPSTGIFYLDYNKPLCEISQVLVRVLAAEIKQPEN